ncbi:MAG: tyrosine-type recombinase/integrase, partial [Chloroflexi bacterium]|nr:tyrosine-type recombinase/integrase [Chloroflexota bacterium]
MSVVEDIPAVARGRRVWAKRCGPGDPGEGHWAHSAYLAFKLHVESQRGLSPATVRNYLSDLGTFWHFLDREGIRGLGEVSRDAMRRYLHWLLSEARVVQRRGRVRREAYVIASVARRFRALRTLFRFLVRHGSLPTDPTLTMSSPKLEHRLPHFLDPNAVSFLLGAPDTRMPSGLRDRAILEMLYAAGLRVSELSGLRLGDIDLTRREVRVLGKGSKERIGLIGRPASDALERYLQHGRPKLQRGPLEQAVFLNRSGGGISQRSL